MKVDNKIVNNNTPGNLLPIYHNFVIKITSNLCESNMLNVTFTSALYVYIIYYALCEHLVNMTHSQLNSSRIERQSLLEKLDNDTELFDECDYLDLTDTNSLDIKECDLNVIHLNVRGIISK